MLYAIRAGIHTPPPLPPCRLRQMSQMYDERPGFMDNTALEGALPSELRAELVEGQDFVLLPEPLWELYVQLWSGNCAIA